MSSSPHHNEAAIIGRCLDALLADATAAPLDVTVVANGCTDKTAALAGARFGVRVVELPEASKPAALNAGDAVATGFPRVYLDADIALAAADVHRLAAAVEAGPALAAVPRRRLALDGRPLPVRAYYAIHSRLPVFGTALFGRGAIALSASGRERFDRFPDVLGDDLFLDSLFTAAEKCEVAEVTSRSPHLGVPAIWCAGWCGSGPGTPPCAGPPTARDPPPAWPGCATWCCPGRGSPRRRWATSA